jgi:hypothetical protein
LKKAPYSLWPEDQSVTRRRWQAKLIAASFVAGMGFGALAPFAISYFGGLVESPAARQFIENRTPVGPAPAIAAQFEALSRKDKQDGNMARLAASASGQRVEIVAARPPSTQQTVDIPLPIQRPPDIEEFSKAMTAFAESSAQAARRVQSSRAFSNRIIKLSAIRGVSTRTPISR